MPRSKGKPKTHLRVPQDFLSEVKRFQKKKGIPTQFEAMKLYLSANKDWKKALIKREAQIEEKFKREYDERLQKATEQNVRKIRDLENEKNIIEKENRDLKQKVKRIPTLELEIETLKAQATSEIEKLKKEIERLSSDERMIELKNEIIILKEEKAVLNEKVNEFERMEEEIKNAYELLEDYERLKEEASQNPRLRKVLSCQAIEIKFMRDTIGSELNRIFKMDSMIDLKLNIEKLMNQINKKADFELEKYQESF
jgi:uncharacterized protein (DUF3084 family)